MAFSLRVFAFSIISLTSSSCGAGCPVALTSSPDDFGNSIPVVRLNGFFQCNPSDPGNDQSPCNAFVGRALKTLYNIADFSDDSGNSFWLANKIATNLKDGMTDWIVAGALLNEDNSFCAQSLANKGYPVIAALAASGHGHVAIVLPGTLSKSGSWGMMAPNSASFRLGNVNLSYVGKSMNWAFSPNDARNAVYYYKIIRPF